MFMILKKILDCRFLRAPVRKKKNRKNVVLLLLQLKCVFDRNEKFVDVKDRNFFSASICFFK